MRDPEEKKIKKNRSLKLQTFKLQNLNMSFIFGCLWNVEFKILIQEFKSFKFLFLLWRFQEF